MKRKASLSGKEQFCAALLYRLLKQRFANSELEYYLDSGTGATCTKQVAAAPCSCGSTAARCCRYQKGSRGRRKFRQFAAAGTFAGLAEPVSPAAWPIANLM